MQTETLVYISIAGITALFIALFQYVYKSKLTSRLKYGLFTLRFITLCIIALLLINPKFETSTLYNEKPNLILAIDNSESIAFLNQEDNALQAVSALRNNEELNKRFNVTSYTFGQNLNELDSLSFTATSTNIANSLESLGEIYKESISPIILVSDGNSTLGIDYSYSAPKIQQSVYPIILGDSTIYTDLSIKQLNVNRFTFLRNRFPVEAIINYSGNSTVSTEIRIKSDDKVLFKKALQFGPNKSSEIITTTILADKVGVKSFVLELDPLANEKNTYNNIKNFGVEVIDQKTNIALISDIIHPDLGMLKKSIESNEQRNVSIFKPSEYMLSEEAFQLLILYQPNRSFNAVIERIEKEKLNVFFITGNTTDWVYLNEIQENFKQSVTNQTEGFQPVFNNNYNNFIIENISFNDFPPLSSEFGAFGIETAHDVLLYKSVNGINTGFALLATYETNDTKQAILNGEGIWRWRSQSYLDTKSFVNFDNFINKLVQYLSSNKRRSRLSLDYQSFYNGNENIIINAQYFNRSYEFDAKAALTLELKPLDTTKEQRQFPLLLSNTSYGADLSGLAAGDYEFTIKHNTESIAASGRFKVLDFNVEQQLLNADIARLEQIADESTGKAYYTNEIDVLINNLLGDSRYNIVQKSSKNVVPLIDISYLLGLLAISLFFEWFLRKYHGLI